MAGQPQKQSARGLVFEGVIATLLIVLIGFSIYAVYLQTRNLRDRQWPTEPAAETSLSPDEQVQREAAQSLADARQALEEVDRTSNTLNLLLAFLQGMTVLAGLALGAAAYVGFRNSRDIRAEFEQLRQQAARQLADIEQYRGDLHRLPEHLTNLRALQTNYQDLLQADQELRLKNYREAYATVMRVLERDPDNVQALYIGGWLELQHIRGQLDQGIEHLEHALKINPNWPAAMAAFGVGLRRQALQATAETRRRDLFNRAEGMLRQALGQNPDLIDLNFESFWGPVAGLLRDTGRIDEAATAYEEARKVTPGSSYPVGNLAALYLQKARSDPAMQAKALRAFQDTLGLAMAELAVIPNDYFLMMDIAMSTMLLGYQDPARFAMAHDQLTQALSMGEATPELLGVSLRGWTFLHGHSPDDQDWDAVRDNLNTAIERINQRLEDYSA